MNQLGQELRNGLNEWASQGICPPDVFSRIETNIRSAGFRKRRSRWPVMMGTVAAAAVLLMVVYGQSIDLSHQLAALPLVGGLAAQFLPGDKVDPAGDRPVVVIRAQGALALSAVRLETDKNETRVLYAIRGEEIDPQGDYMADPPVLKTPGGTVPLQRLEVTPVQGGVDVKAHFARVPDGIPLTFVIDALPTTRGIREIEPFQVTLDN